MNSRVSDDIDGRFGQIKLSVLFILYHLNDERYIGRNPSQKHCLGKYIQ